MKRPASSMLLAATGVLHIAVTVLADRGEVRLWSLVFGVAMLAIAAAWRALETRGEPLPASFAAWLAAMGLLVVVPLPASGGWLLFPQAALIVSRARRDVPEAVRGALGDWLPGADVV